MTSRILLAAPLDGATGEYLAKGFSAAGVTPIHYPYRQYATAYGLDRMNQDFAEAATEVDAVFILKGEFFHPKVLRAIRQSSVPIAAWHLDPWCGQQPWVLDVAREVDTFFTIAKGLLPVYAADGANAKWLLEACDPETHAPQPVDPHDPFYEASFIGTIEGVAGREEWLRLIHRDLASGLHLFGSQPGPYATMAKNHHGRPEQMLGVKGDQGLSWVVSHTQVNLGRDRNPEIERSYGARLFRTLAAGGYLLTNNTKGLREDFPRGLGIYGSDADCVARIRWALGHRDAIAKEAEAGRKLVLAQHTFTHRAKTILQEMGL